MRAAVTVLVVSFVLACQSGAVFDEQARAQVESEVEAAHLSLLEVIGSADLERIFASFARDGLAVDFGVAYPSREVMEDAYRTGWNVARMEMGEPEIRVSAMDENNAVVFTNYRLKQFSPDGEIVLDVENPVLATWTRRDGRWMPHSTWQDALSPVDGIWSYQPPLDGGAIYSRGRFIHLIGSTDAPGEVTRSLGGTYTVRGDTVYNTIENDSNPTNVGETFKWTWEFSGDTATFRVVGEDGEIVQTGRTVRIGR